MERRSLRSSPPRYLFNTVPPVQRESSNVEQTVQSVGCFYTFIHTRILSGGCNLRIHAFSFFFSTVIFGQLFFFFENGKKQVSARLTRIDLAFRCSRGKFFSFRSIKNKTNVCRRIYTQTYIHTYTYHAFNLSNPL